MIPHKQKLFEFYHSLMLLGQPSKYLYYIGKVNINYILMDLKSFKIQDLIQINTMNKVLLSLW